LIKGTFRGSTLWVLGLRFSFVFVSPGFSSLDCGEVSPGLSLRSWSRIELLTLIEAFRGLRQLREIVKIPNFYFLVQITPKSILTILAISKIVKIFEI